MLDKVRLACVRCGNVSFHSQAYIEGQIKAMKIHKAREVALQLHEKRGPFYDKWLAAMEKRGEQKRCKDCTQLRCCGKGRFRCRWSMSIKLVKPAWFACRAFIQR